MRSSFWKIEKLEKAEEALCNSAEKKFSWQLISFLIRWGRSDECVACVAGDTGLLSAVGLSRSLAEFCSSLIISSTSSIAHRHPRRSQQELDPLIKATWDLLFQFFIPEFPTKSSRITKSPSVQTRSNGKPRKKVEHIELLRIEEVYGSGKGRR